MNALRYQHLSETGEPLSPAEMRAGWHYCPEWDMLLTKPGLEPCGCKPWTEEQIANREQVD